MGVEQELLAILEQPDAFTGASSLRTYATGILMPAVSGGHPAQP